MSNKAGNAEKLLREKSDRIEHLKKSLMEADEKNKALMEFVFEHKMCQQKVTCCFCFDLTNIVFYYFFYCVYILAKKLNSVDSFLAYLFTIGDWSEKEWAW